MKLASCLVISTPISWSSVEDLKPSNSGGLYQILVLKTGLKVI